MNGYNRNTFVNLGGPIQQDDSQNFRCNYDKNGFWHQNNSLLPLRPNEKNLHENRAENAACLLSSGLFQPSHVEQPSLGNTSTLPPSSSSTFNQYIAYESSTTMENSQSSDYPQGISSYEQGKNFSSNYDPSKTYGLASQAQWLLENFQKSLVQSAVSSDIVDQKAYSLKNVADSACNLRQDDDPRRGLDNTYPSVVGQDLTGAFVFLKDQLNGIPVKNELQASSGYISGVANCAAENNCGDGNGDQEIRNPSRLSAAGSLFQLLKGESSPKSVSINPSIKGHDSKDEVCLNSGKLDDHAASVVVDKLWDGYLQLNSSVKLSTVAYFKSGEKMPDISWSQCIAVKGKVRLEAFEKYIQELPRSRNRGLMVMSLCLKEGSSCKSGHVGIKEVAKKLNEGKRVGLAQLSPGVDLYVCPQSDSIVTILAKHGFFKDMISAKDNQDSLIGCVVWRRTTSDQITKRVDENNGPLLEKPLSSPSCSNNELQISVSNLSSAKPRGEAIQPIGSVNNDNRENREIISCNVPVASSISFSAPTPGVSSSSVSFALDSKQQALPPGDLNTIHSIVKQLSEIEASIFKSLGLENYQGKLELLKAILPPFSNPMKPQPLPMPNSEDDDLPEYDFSFAAAVDPTSRPFIEVKEAANKMLQGDRFKQSNESNRSSPMCIESQKDFVLGGPILQKRKAQELENACLSSTREAGDGRSRPKNLFNDDDDDMPEWKPPDLEPLKPSLAQSTGPPSNAFRASQSSFASSASTSNLPPLLPTPPPSDRLPFPPKQLPSCSHNPTGHNKGMARPPQLPLSRARGDAYVRESPRSSSNVSSDRASRPYSRPYVSKGSTHDKRSTGWKS